MTNPEYSRYKIMTKINKKKAYTLIIIAALLVQYNLFANIHVDCSAIQHFGYLVGFFLFFLKQTRVMLFKQVHNNNIVQSTFRIKM